MEYKSKITESNELFQERLELVMERLQEIAKTQAVPEPFREYFKTVAEFLLLQYQVKKLAEEGTVAAWSKEEGALWNQKLYAPFMGEQYGHSYANPTFGAERLGQEYGALFAALLTRIQQNTPFLFEGNAAYLCIYGELTVELYNCLEQEEEQSEGVLLGIVHSFMHDNSDIFMEERIARLVDPDYDYEFGILMEADLEDTAYLYRYGRYVRDNEIKSSSYLATFTDQQIQAMADTYTDGYIKGFEVTGKDIKKKTTVEIRYPLGFERMVRCAVRNFSRIGLRAVVKPFSTAFNRQYEYDHREDAALWLDKAMVERELECSRVSFEKRKSLAAGYGGPAVIEVFGEEPFSPEKREANPRYSGKQQKLAVYQQGELSRITNEYIHGEERSFTIIAYPIPAIGERYREIFAETVRLNTLDYVLYRDMQQKIIDVLDTAERVHISGAGNNKTDLYVKIFPLANPEKETAFENCVADVNIPVGEVFTSPVLEGTNGKLYVSQVYLNGLSFQDLEIDFKEGMISAYTCSNFDSEEDCKKYILDNVLMHHESLPMGEFAIGTNTTAYRMARMYGIADKLPILIAEKTGPHFAVGDTCYTYDEDNMTYNPDGKAIVARDNSVSILRREDVSKAYFSCHTDITIPYDELAGITVIRADGTTQDIIRDRRFVLPGTEALNEPLEDLENQK